MNRAPRRRLDPRWRLLALGLAGVLAALAIVLVSYRANSGLPFQGTYRITVEVPDALRLVRNNDVRIAGVRAGRIDRVEAVPGSRGTHARLTLALATDAGPLRADTAVRVRPASILGTNYLDLVPGRAGRELPSGASLPLRNASSTVELTDLLDVFDRSAGRRLQATLGTLGVGLAGRGPALGQALGALPPLLGDLGRVSRTLAAPGTRLGPLLVALDDATRALAPVAGELASATDGAAATFDVLARHGRALAATLVALPPAEASVTRAFTRLQPALEDLDALSAALTPAVGLLPAAVPAIDRTLARGVRPLRDLRAFAPVLGRTFASVRRLGATDGVRGALQHAGGALQAANGTLETLLPAQLQCNVIGLWATNFASTFGSLGTGQGPALANIGVTHLGADNELLQNPRPSKDAAINLLPNQGTDECESGNEPYAGRQVLGSPPGRQSARTRETRQQPAVRRLAERAGLHDDGGGTP
ncbi:MlaD family protein [Patulibacter brassicae]|jgi:phospholipid/cholesterol/gamma-HCH transport system substrate-binding protein|uniref:MlaD family protein n=1 Tax=Patulibacter brassicae TaxID=1705717 RepID=A0ABU4VJ18_9ACTN|nr:MlaD family protein [Patulibacter brassicae]MDX8151821.1 MlaD family protein [Patulibacter brassicae]